MCAAPAVIVPDALNRFVFGKLAVAAIGAGMAALCIPAGRWRRELRLAAIGGSVILLMAALASTHPIAAVLGRAPRYEGVFALATYTAAAWASARLLGPGSNPRLALCALRVLSAIALLTALLAAVEAAGLRPLSTDVARPGSLFGNASDEGAAGVLCLGPLALVAIRRCDRVLGIGAISAVTVTILSASRGAIAAALVELVLIGVVLGGRRAAGFSVAAVAAFLGLAVSVPATRDRILGTSPFAGHTVTGRELLWGETLKLDSSHLLLGIGPSNYKTAIVGYHTLAWQQHVGPQEPPDSPHNWPLQALSVGGLPLLILAILLAALVLTAGTRRALQARRSDLPLPTGCLLAVIGYGFTLLVGVTSPGPMLLASLLVGILLSRPVSPDPTAAGLKASLAGRMRASVLFALGALLGLAAVAEIPLREAIVDVSQGRDAAANQAFHTAGDLRPWDVDLDDLAAHAFLTAAVGNGNASAAEYGAKWLGEVSEELSDDEQIQLDSATSDELRRNYPAALATLTNVLRTDHDNPLVLLRRGVVEAESGLAAAARQDFAEAADVDPTDPGPWQDLAVLDEQQGHHRQAEIARSHAELLEERSTAEPS